MADPAARPADERGLLILITGTGRSGTSTMSGTLSHLGLNVPGPYLGANKSNPKGFFESKWAVQFHKRITRRARINDFDGRPDALSLARDAVNPALRTDLHDFLTEHLADSPQLVVKDPRTVWSQYLWAETAEEVGLSIRYLSMLRHPAEVIGSRVNYYASKADEAQRKRYETFNIARWINSSIISERETRGARRTFVAYNDLLDDWRGALSTVRDDLGLTFDSDLDPASPHAVDEFIDPGLRRIRVTWDDVDVPHRLRDIAQETWDNLVVLSRSGGDDAAAAASLDTLGEDYRNLFAESIAIAHDEIEATAGRAKRQGAKEAREKLLREQAEQAPEPSDPATDQHADAGVVPRGLAAVKRRLRA
ncbi:MAG: sulfotransferase family protein, partial [Nocardioidaceae bacterium]